MMERTAALDARLLTRRSTGDTSYWRGLITALAEIDSEFRFLLFSNSERPAGIPESPRLIWKRVPTRSNRYWSLVQFPRHAKAQGADLIHAQYTISPFAKLPSVTTIHDVSFLVGPEWFRPKDRALLRWQIPKTAERATRIITVSETSRKEIEQHIPASRGKVRVTHNALGPNIQPMPIEEARRIVQSQLNITRPYVMTVGTRWPRKNMQLAIKAMEKIDEDLPQALVITGKPGWGEEQLGPRSRIMGYLAEQELTALYQCADLYLAPSFHEGFGIPLLEAFACGCPVLASSGGALPEVAQNAAEVETTFDVDSWGRTITRLLRSTARRDELRKAGADRLQDFDWHTTAQKTIEVYREAIGEAVE